MCPIPSVRSEAYPEWSLEWSWHSVRGTEGATISARAACGIVRRSGPLGSIRCAVSNGSSAGAWWSPGMAIAALRRKNPAVDGGASDAVWTHRIGPDGSPAWSAWDARGEGPWWSKEPRWRDPQGGPGARIGERTTRESRACLRRHASRSGYVPIRQVPSLGAPRDGPGGLPRPIAVAGQRPPGGRWMATNPRPNWRSSNGIGVLGYKGRPHRPFARPHG